MYKKIVTHLFQYYFYLTIKFNKIKEKCRECNTIVKLFQYFEVLFGEVIQLKIVIT